MPQATDNMNQQMNTSTESTEPLLQSPDTLTLNLQGDVKICIPDAVENIISYVLREQESWVDKETTFIQALIETSSRVVDIDSNYGIYALPIAKKAKNVLIFETNPKIISCLQDSMEANDSDNIAIIDEPLNNSIDAFVDKFKLIDIDFIRINVTEGLHSLVANSPEFFKNNNTIAMCGRHHDMQQNFQLLAAFSQYNYQCYCLLPGLNVLAPIDDIESIDSFLTNIFFCNQATAERLNKKNLLCTEIPDADKILESTSYNWELFLDRYEYAKSLMNLWQSKEHPQGEDSDKSSSWNQYQKALNLYAIAHKKDQPVNERTTCLYKAFELLSTAIQLDASFPKLLTMARLSLELGLQDSAIQTLKVLLELLCSTETISADEPFLAVHSIFDKVDPGEKLGEWCFSSIFQTYSWIKSYSTFFAKDLELQGYEQFRNDPFIQARTERARQLIKMKMRLQVEPEKCELLSNVSEHNLNPEIWK